MTLSCSHVIQNNFEQGFSHYLLHMPQILNNTFLFQSKTRPHKLLIFILLQSWSLPCLTDDSKTARLIDESTSLSTAFRACHIAIDPPNNKIHKAEKKIRRLIW